MASFSKKLKHAYNAFSTSKTTTTLEPSGGYASTSYGVRPDRIRGLNMMGEKSIVASIYTRISIDIASIQMRHVKLDEQGRFLQNLPSGLNECLTIEANIDQASREFRQDIAMTLCTKGYLALVPIDTSLDPSLSNTYDIKTMRVGEIVRWEPRKVLVSLYNDRTGVREELLLDKTRVAIVTNPLYAIMNEPNSTLQRLIRKLSLLDAVDEATASGKLDMIIQLPYVIKSEARKQQAEQRRADLEEQLTGSTYGIAYTDGTEKITQLNRPVDNNLMSQIDYLTKMLYGQLGLTEEVLNGTADEKTTLNYWNRTIEPMTSAITEAMHRTFLTKTARTQMQAIRYFRDPFRLVPIDGIAEIADKFTRNEIMTSNEFRQVVGMVPSGDPKADQLVNSNMPQPGPEPVSAPAQDSDPNEEKVSSMMGGALDGLNSQVDDMLAGFGGEDDE